MRIFVPYFAILAATIVGCLIVKAATGDGLLMQDLFTEAPHMHPAAWAYAILSNLSIVGQEWGFLLMYRAGELVYSLQAYSHPPTASQFILIGPAWTLSIELMFYLLAPFLLRRHILIVAAVAYLSYALRFEGYHVGYYSEATNYRFFPFEVSLFLYGALVQRASALLLVPPPAAALLTFLTAMLVVFKPSYFNANQYQLYAVIGALLPALFTFTSRNAWDRWLGELSFPLYLVHWPVLAFVTPVVRHFMPQAIGSKGVYPCLAVALAIGAAIAINHVVIEPSDRWRHRRAAQLQSPSRRLVKAAQVDPRAVAAGE